MTIGIAYCNTLEQILGSMIHRHSTIGGHNPTDSLDFVRVTLHRCGYVPYSYFAMHVSGPCNDLMATSACKVALGDDMYFRSSPAAVAGPCRPVQCSPETQRLCGGPGGAQHRLIHDGLSRHCGSSDHARFADAVPGCLRECRRSLWPIMEDTKDRGILDLRGLQTLIEKGRVVPSMRKMILIFLSRNGQHLHRMTPLKYSPMHPGHILNGHDHSKNIKLLAIMTKLQRCLVEKGYIQVTSSVRVQEHYGEDIPLSTAPTQDIFYRGLHVTASR